MFVVLKSSDTMSCLPTVNQDFSILSFVTKRASQPAVIFVSVRQHDAANVRDAKARMAQAFAQSLGGLFRLWPRVNQRDGVFRDEIAIDRPDVEGRGD
jgi:hypothetical protein